MRLRECLDHRFAQRHMSDFVDGALSARARRRIQRHADACPECGPLRGALVRLVGELSRLRIALGADRSIAPLVVARIRGCHAVARRRRRSRS
ncbi:MAG: zf-HC2 domain-containing protein [Actinobacteria bacterium]|nr:zf-HC2 domain-containing protein [Actinomycetota bacterium]